MTDNSEIIKFLKRRRGQYVFSLLVRDIALSASVVFVIAAALQIAFAAFPWTMLPIAWDLLILGLFTVSVITAIDKLFLRKQPLLRIAERIEESLHLKPRWISLAVELSSPKSSGSGQLIDEVARLAVLQIKQGSPSIRRRMKTSEILFLATALLAWCAISVFVAPRISSFWDLPLTIGAPVKAKISPGTVTIPERASITLRCSPLAREFPSCSIVLTDISDGMTQSLLLRPDSSGCFHFPRDSLQRSFCYQFSIGVTAFPAETVFVVPPPTLARLSIRLIEPAYVGAHPVQLPEGQGNFSAYSGAIAQFSIAAPRTLSRAAFRSSTGDSISFSVAGKQANGEVFIRKKCDYSFTLTDTLGQKNDSHPRFSIDLTPDMPPLVQILKPGADKELSPALVETLLVEATDDLGLKLCSLEWRKNSEPRDAVHAINLLKPGSGDKSMRVRQIWDLGECSLYPGDTLFYWAFARDNAPSDAGHYCVSPTFRFRLPTFEEIRERIAQEQNNTESSLNAAQQKEKALNGALDDLMKSAKGKESLTWEQKQITKDIEETIRAQSDTIAKAALSLKRAIDKLKEQGLSSKDIVDKMENIRKALEEIARDFGDSLLFEPLQKNQRTISADELKESLEKFQKMLPDLSKRLDNAFKYLKMLKRDRRLAALASAAEKYGKDELSLASDTVTKQAEQQKNLSEKVDKLLSEISREFDKDSALFSKGDISSFDGVQSMQQAIKGSLKKKGTAESAMMNRMSAGLLSMSRELLDLQSGAMMRKLSQDKKLLMEMSREALSMAQWQDQMQNDSGAQGINAQSQQALRKAIMTSAEKLNNLSMAPPQLLRNLMKQYDSAISAMDMALQFFKSGMDPEGAMNESKDNLHSLAFSLLQSANSMEGQNGEGQGSGDLMCGLQRLSGKQAMINGMTGEILRQMLGENGARGEEPGEGQEGGKATDARKERARKQAQEAQQSIAEELKKLSEKYGKDAENGLGKKAQDLEEEARRLSRMLENPQPEIQDRQNRFLSRMLQTTLSMHKQDEGKEERKSRSAKEIFSNENVQAGGTALYGRDTFFRIRQKAFSSDVPEGYRTAIKNYFDSLSALYLR